jgi:hypothetical protein
MGIVRLLFIKEGHKICRHNALKNNAKLPLFYMLPTERKRKKMTQPTRLTMVVNENTDDRISEISRMDGSTKAQALRNAIYYYYYFSKEVASGKKLQLIDLATNETVKVTLPVELNESIAITNRPTRGRKPKASSWDQGDNDTLQKMQLDTISSNV